MRRFFGQQDPSDPSTLLLSGSESRHACKVLRLAPGNRVIIMAGGGEYDCSITEITDSLTRAVILAERPRAESRMRITLAQGVIKGPAMDDAVRLAAELGASALIPLITGRVVPSLTKGSIEGKLARWRAIAQSAAKITASPEPCQILSPMEISGLGRLPGFDMKIVFWELGTAPLKSILQNAPAPAAPLLVIGPEGGFLEEEISALESEGFASASLGDRILRAHTAGPAALMALTYHYGR